MDFHLKGEFIELDNLLKATDIAAGGAQARQFVLDGAVKINGQVESRIRRKLRAGDRVEVAGSEITIVT